MTAGYLITCSILLIGILVMLGVYFSSVILENQELKKREKALRDSFNRARGTMSFDDYRFKDYE